MKLYNAGLSPNALRVRAVANELGFGLDIVDVDLRSGGNRAPDFLKVNPNGKVPVLVDGDFVLWESRAINAYLATLRPQTGLYPADPRKRAIIDQWTYWHAMHLGPAMQRIVFERLLKGRFGLGDPDEAAIAPSIKEVAQFMPVLDDGLKRKEWIAGALSIADFAMATTFVYRKAGKIETAQFKNVEAWIARMEARPAWQKAVAPMKAFAA